MDRTRPGTTTWSDLPLCALAVHGPAAVPARDLTLAQTPVHVVVVAAEVLTADCTGTPGPATSPCGGDSTAEPVPVT